MKLLKLLVMALAVSSLAVAMPIVGLYSTGLTSDGTALGTVGGQEVNWQVNGETAYITQTGQFPFPFWTANSSTSQWISPSASYASGGNPTPGDAPGIYEYTLSFDLTGYDHTTATFSYLIGADDRVQSVYLNSTSLPGATSTFTPLDGPNVVAAGVGSGFIAGVNQITIEVLNESGHQFNPSGLRFEVLESDVEELVNPVPEPATFALVGLALAAIPVIRRRR